MATTDLQELITEAQKHAPEGEYSFVDVRICETGTHIIIWDRQWIDVLAENGDAYRCPADASQVIVAGSGKTLAAAVEACATFLETING